MDRRIRVLGLLLVLSFALLFFQLNNWQVRQASALAQNPDQPANSIDTFTEPRGAIVTSDGTVMATSTVSNDEYKEQRVYPDGSLYEDVTGYYDVVQSASTGLEAEYDGYLTEHQSNAQNLDQILTEHEGVDNVVTTISEKLQNDVRSALAGRYGAVVAIDPKTGAILAIYGNPTFNPNLLASHNAAAVNKAYTKLADAADPSSSPLINAATQQTYPPGSTMKVVTTSAIFDHDPSLANKTWPAVSFTALPDTDKTLSNFDGESCGGDLARILAQSCDTAFGLIGISLGAQNLQDEAKSFGFDSVPPIDLPQGEVDPAVFPALSQLAKNPPFVAYSAIGQFDVTETALEDALVASAIGNGGNIMTPHLMSRIVESDGTVVTTYKPHVWRQATSSSTAASVRSLMLGVARSGTAAGLFPPSLDVAAKTGTAQTGAVGCSANWLVATAPAGSGDTPKIAVAAVVPYQPGLGCGETGATIAGPIVSTVLQDGLKIEG